MSRRSHNSKLIILLSILLCQTAFVSCRKSAALVIGGTNQGELGPNDTPLANVELYGCENNQEYTISLNDFPKQIRQTSGTWIPDDSLASGGYVLLCGGYSCPVNEGEDASACGQSAECYQWDPETDAWTIHSELTQPRVNDIITLTPPLGDPDELVPLAVGGNLVTSEIYLNGGWQTYQDLPSDDWSSLGCFQAGNSDILYHIGENITVLNLNDWSTFDLDQAPEQFQFPGTCSIMVDPNDDSNLRFSIYTRYGFSYRLAEGSWFKASPPPLSYLSAGNPPNSMLNFRGVPTYVGFPNCDDDGVCADTAVASFDPETDEWTVWKEQLLTGRRAQLVVEVPAEVCDAFSPLVHNFDDTAALIIGGFPGERLDFNAILDDVELYGCGDLQDDLPPIQSFPSGIALAGATFLHTDDGGRVLVCGGFQCQQGDTQTCVYNTCYEWNPRDNEWTLDSTLNQNWNEHLLTSVTNLETGDDDVYVPIVLGQNRRETEIYNLDTKQWDTYKNLPEGADRWLASECLTPYNGKLYLIDSSETIVVTDLGATSDDDDAVFAAEVAGVAPPSFSSPRMCPVVQIDGQDGIFVRYGYWYNLATNVWEVKSPPPLSYLSVTSQPNHLVSWRGRPTYFGFPECDAQGACSSSRVIQYDPDEDRWDDLSPLAGVTRGRGQNIVEVPADFCTQLYESERRRRREAKKQN